MIAIDFSSPKRLTNLLRKGAEFERSIAPHFLEGDHRLERSLNHPPPKMYTLSIPQSIPWCLRKAGYTAVDRFWPNDVSLGSEISPWKPNGCGVEQVCGFDLGEDCDGEIRIGEFSADC